MKLVIYKGIKNLNALITLALYFIYLDKSNIEKIALGFPKILHYKKEDLSILKEFIYY
jgi:hypothetical protein